MLPSARESKHAVDSLCRSVHVFVLNPTSGIRCDVLLPVDAPDESLSEPPPLGTGRENNVNTQEHS